VFKVTVNLYAGDVCAVTPNRHHDQINPLSSMLGPILKKSQKEPRNEWSSQ